MRTDEKKALTRRQKRAIALIVGMLLALACKSLPQGYHAACDAIVKLCTGGL